MPRSCRNKPHVCQNDGTCRSMGWETGCCCLHLFQRKAAHPVLEREGVDRPTGLVWRALALPFASSVTLGI